MQEIQILYCFRAGCWIRRLKGNVTAKPTQFYSVSISGISFLLATCESREWIASQLLYNTVYIIIWEIVHNAVLNKSIEI